MWKLVDIILGIILVFFFVGTFGWLLMIPIFAIAVCWKLLAILFI